MPRRAAPQRGSQSTLDALTAISGAEAVSDAYLAPKQSERSFQGQVVAYARMTGWVAWEDKATNMPRACRRCRAPIQWPRNAAGHPDLLLIRVPRVVWAELKSERGRLSDDQRAWIAALRASGQEVYIWRPSDFEAIERILR